MSRAVWIAGAAAILPIAAICAAEVPPTDHAFTPPSTPLMLTRTLRHMLHDGKAVVTRRSYRVQFAEDEGGFRLDGSLAEVTVEAPPGLETFAELERRRPDTGLFPIRLDAAGMILPSPDPAPSAQQRQALGAAAAGIARMNLTPADAEQARGFVSQLQVRPYRTSWPQDLFRPAPGPRREQRRIPLDGDAGGQVTTETEVSTDPASGLLAALTRTVTTDLGGDRRVVVEEWRLAPAP